jgi:hypothetical protein
MINITSKQLRKAAKIADKLEALQKNLGDLLNGLGNGAVAQQEPIVKRRYRRHHKMSPEGRAAISAASKKRWRLLKAAR